jgi:hypothetical protein
MHTTPLSVRTIAPASSFCSPSCCVTAAVRPLQSCHGHWWIWGSGVDYKTQQRALCGRGVSNEKDVDVAAKMQARSDVFFLAAAPNNSSSRPFSRLSWPWMLFASECDCTSNASEGAAIRLFAKVKTLRLRSRFTGHRVCEVEKHPAAGWWRCGGLRYARRGGGSRRGAVVARFECCTQGTPKRGVFHMNHLEPVFSILW